MKPKIYLILLWDNLGSRMLQKRIETVKDARYFVQTEFERQKLDYVFGQIVYSDDSRKDIFQNLRKQRKELLK